MPIASRVLAAAMATLIVGCATIGDRGTVPPADFDVLILNGTVIAHGRTQPTALDVGIVGDVDRTEPAMQKVLFDTIWLVEWTHDTPGPCWRSICARASPR